MALEREIPPLFDWIGSGLLYWVLMTIGVGVLALLAAALVTSVRNGPAAALSIISTRVLDALVDMAMISPRRVLAFVILTVRESFRLWAWVVFVLFLGIIMFAAWFLDPDTEDPARLYLNFVLTCTMWLMILLALLLSAVSLPNDMKTKTIYTIVTKPVRASEIVLGRSLGFVAVGTALLILMAPISYLFVVRSVQHTHEVFQARPVESPSTGNKAVVAEAATSTVGGHAHRVFIFRDGTASTDYVHGHRHDVITETVGSETRYVLSGPTDMLLARVPLFGDLKYRDRTNRVGGAEVGIDVGKEWSYRKYIEGGTNAAAIWRFEGLSGDDFPNGMPIEMTIRVYRTHKGQDITSGKEVVRETEIGVPGQIVLKNPRTGESCNPIFFRAKEFTTLQLVIPREVPSGLSTTSVFDKLVSNGQLDVELQCRELGQFYGMAKPDLYIRAAENRFGANFLLGYLGIWCQMALVTFFGVMFSTCLNSAVTMLATLAVVVAGYFKEFMMSIAVGTAFGGGPAEAFYRTMTKKNIIIDLEPSLQVTVATQFDKIVLRPFIFAVCNVVPDFRQLSDVEYVAEGFSIPMNNLLSHGLVTLGYLFPVFVLGYFLLKIREVAK
jgi:hypothetical protein